MTRYTVMLFQDAYPDQIRIEKYQKDDTINIECWLLNEDYEPHMLLFDGGGFKNDEQIDTLIEKILEIKL